MTTRPWINSTWLTMSRGNIKVMGSIVLSAANAMSENQTSTFWKNTSSSMSHQYVLFVKRSSIQPRIWKDTPQFMRSRGVKNAAKISNQRKNWNCTSPSMLRWMHLAKICTLTSSGDTYLVTRTFAVQINKSLTIATDYSRCLLHHPVIQCLRYGADAVWLKQANC